MGIRVSASFDDPCDTAAELLADFLQQRFAALVFHGVMQQRRNSLIFVAAVRKHDGRHTKKVRNVWTRGSFTELGGV